MMAKKRRMLKKRSSKLVKAPRYEVVLKKYDKKGPVEKRFVVTKGEKLRTIKDAVYSLEKMSADIFKHHLIDFRKNFADWFKSSFNEKKIADEISNIKSRFEEQKKLMKKVFEKFEKLSKKKK